MSPRAPAGLTFDQKVERRIRNIRNLSQYRQKLESGELDAQEYEDFLAEQAKRLVMASEQRQNEQIKAANRQIEFGNTSAGDEAFKEDRLATYTAQYGDWDDAGDRALLLSLVELETQQRIIVRSLSQATKITDKERYWRALKDNSEAQQRLQATLGIDKKSREAIKIKDNPMENWENIKTEVGNFYDMLISEFPKAADDAQSEAELRDMMKYKLSWPFSVVDAILRNLKRLNGLEATVQTEYDRKKE